jgi:hypothetical protein
MIDQDTKRALVALGVMFTSAVGIATIALGVLKFVWWLT